MKFDIYFHLITNICNMSSIYTIFPCSRALEESLQSTPQTSPAEVSTEPVSRPQPPPPPPYRDNDAEFELALQLSKQEMHAAENRQKQEEDELEMILRLSLTDK